MGPIFGCAVCTSHDERSSVAATITQIAMDYGFWELGRFSVSYQGLVRRITFGIFVQAIELPQSDPSSPVFVCRFRFCIANTGAIPDTGFLRGAKHKRSARQRLPLFRRVHTNDGDWYGRLYQSG